MQNQPPTQSLQPSHLYQPATPQTKSMPTPLIIGGVLMGIISLNGRVEILQFGAGNVFRTCHSR